MALGKWVRSEEKARRPGEFVVCRQRRWKWISGVSCWDSAGAVRGRECHQHRRRRRRPAQD